MVSLPGTLVTLVSTPLSSLSPLIYHPVSPSHPLASQSRNSPGFTLHAWQQRTWPSPCPFSMQIARGAPHLAAQVDNGTCMDFEGLYHLGPLEDPGRVARALERFMLDVESGQAAQGITSRM